jgi:hypothetical protein
MDKADGFEEGGLGGGAFEHSGVEGAVMLGEGGEEGLWCIAEEVEDVVIIVEIAEGVEAMGGVIDGDGGWGFGLGDGFGGGIGLPCFDEVLGAGSEFAIDEIAA